MGDNFQFWLYVIIAIIYVISKAMKKSNRQRQEQAPPTPRPRHREAAPDEGEPDEGLPPMSFEELLREITEGKKRQPPQPVPPPQPAKTPPAPRPRPEFVDYSDDIDPDEKSLERTNYDRQRQETTRQVYERAQREATLKSSLGGLQSGIQGRKSSLESLQSSLGGESTRFESFRIGDKHALVAEYIKELRTPSGMKKAVVLSEILKPKF